MEILKYDAMTTILGLNEATINRLKKSFPTEEELYCVAWCAINSKKVALGKSAAAFKDAALAQGLLYEASAKEKAVRKLAAFCCQDEHSPFSLDYYRHENGCFVEGSFSAVDEISSERCDEAIQFVKETLTPLEYSVISRRCGFESEPMTLEEVGKAISATRERVRQIEAKAFRKLYQPQHRQRIVALAQSYSEIRQTVEELMDERADLSKSPEVRRYLEVCEEIRRYKEDFNNGLTGPTETIEGLGLSHRATSCLERKGINTLAKLLRMSTIDLLQVRNLSKKCYEEVLEKIHDLGYKLKDEE